MFADQSLITNPNENYFSFQARKYNEGKFPKPSEIISGSSHIVVVDSRERDRTKFPSPSKYAIKFSDNYKNITSVELKGSLLPKTEYNIHSGNNKIVFNVEDFITRAIIKDGGEGYVDGVYGFGAVAPNDTLVSVTDPGLTGGINAEVTVTVVRGSITEVTIADGGSGYLRGHYGTYEYPDQGFYRNSGAAFINSIPFRPNSDTYRRRATVQFEVGHELIAELTPGQYDFANPNDSLPGLCAEVTRALQVTTQLAIDNNVITLIPGGPTTGEQYFPTGAGDTGSCFLFTPNINASENSNVVIQRGQDDGSYQQYLFLELIWGESSYKNSNASKVLGFASTMVPTLGPTPLDKTSGVGNDVVAWTSTPIQSQYDYCLTDIPKYCILTFSTGGSTADRIESTNATLDKGFATLVFDANSPDVVFREPVENPTPGEGNSNYSTLLSKPGTMKGIKGADFERKILSFGPVPKAELSGIYIEFRKFNGDFYDFHGKEHVLLFELKANDINSGNRW